MNNYHQARISLIKPSKVLASGQTKTSAQVSGLAANTISLYGSIKQYIQFFVAIKKYFHPIALLRQKHIKFDISSPF